MRKLLATVLVLAMLLGALPALAESGAADIGFEGTSYHLVYESAEIVDGELTVKISGYGSSVPLRNGLPVILAQAGASFSGETVKAYTVDAGSDGVYTFRFHKSSLPDALWLYPYDDADNPVQLWPASQADAEPLNGVDEPAPAPTRSAGHFTKSGSGSPGVAQPTAEPTVAPTAEPTVAPTAELTVAPTAEPTPEPTAEPVEEPVTGPTGDDEVTYDVLDALGEDVYRTTYEALRAGEVIEKGSKGDTAKGLQQTLIAFGQKISADGDVGGKTLSALNAVQEAFGLEKTDTVDAQGYAQLLPRLLVSTDESAAERVLGGMQSGEYDYMKACVLYLNGKYYDARKAFESSYWGDYSDRAASCVQPWPKNGQIYKSGKGSGVELTVKVSNMSDDQAMLVKIYKTDGTLVSCLFIGGNSKASTKLSKGTYVIKRGIGTDWYGLDDAFGASGFYQLMTFNNGDTSVTLKSGYAYTITVGSGNGNGVGSEYESWGNF